MPISVGEMVIGIEAVGRYRMRLQLLLRMPVGADAIAMAIGAEVCVPCSNNVGLDFFAEKV